LDNTSYAVPSALAEVAADDETVVVDLIETFLADTTARIRQMRLAVANGDASRLRGEAHTIKGSAKQIGADSLATTCHELESSDSPITALETLLRRIEDQFKEISVAMIEYCERSVARR
jgi:HPt (histidine-containing phosphotransfer) domain-containing protein